MRPVFGDALMVHFTVHSCQVPEFSLATTDLNGTPASPRESYCALRSDDTDATSGSCLWPHVGWIGYHAAVSCSLLNDRHPRLVNAYRRSKGLALVAGASLESFGHDRSDEMLFTRRSLPTVLLPILVAGSVNAQPEPKGIAKAATPTDPFAFVTKEQWRADLHFLARELPKRHANAFHHTPRERFDAEVADLDRRIDSLNGDEIYVGLDRIANLVGDGHTFVEFPDDKARLPVQIEQFGDQYRVTAVAPGMEKALGA